MSVHPLSWVLKNSEESGGRRLVLIVLADHAKDDGTCAWPSVETIGREARMTRRPVQEALRALERSGAIRPTGKSRSGTTIYTVVCPLNPHEEGGAESAPPGSAAIRAGGRESTSEGALPPAPDPSLEQPSEPSGPPRAIKIDGRFLARDTLAEVCGVAEGSPRERSLDAALNGSREVGPGIRSLVWAGATEETRAALLADGDAGRRDFDALVATEIRRRARLYRERFSGDVELTPTALAKWFVDVARPRRGGAGANLSASEEPSAALPEVSEAERRDQAARAREMMERISRSIDADVPRCESCGAALVWAITKRGKRQPFDREPVPEGSVLLRHEGEPGSTPIAHVVRKAERVEMEAQAAARGETLRLFMPHHATCPDAAKHRRRSG